MRVATAPGLAVQQRGRAERTLFALHYRRTLMPLLLVYFGVLGMLMAVCYGYAAIKSLGASDSAQLNNIVNGVAIGLAFALALPVGTAVFSRSFKEQQILFFHALPLSRGRQWLTMVGASFAALLTIYALAVIVRPGVVRLVSDDLSTAIGLAAAVLLTFSAGACFALVFTRPVAVYAFAYLTTFALFMLAVLTTLAPYDAFAGAKSDAYGRSLEPYASQIPLRVEIVPVALMTLVFLGCSFHFYRRGEFGIVSTQIRNFLIAAGAGLVVSVGATRAAIEVAIRQSPAGTSVETSADGRFAMVEFRARSYPWRSRVAIVDIDRAAIVASIPSNGALGYWWAPDGSLAVARRDMSLLHRLGGYADHLAVYSRTGQLAHEFPFRGQEITEVTEHPGGLLLITDDGNTGHVYQWTAPDQLRELVSAPLDHPRPTTWAAGELALFGNRIAPPRAWQIREGRATELPWAKATAERFSARVVRGIVFPDAESAVRQIERDVPLPRASGESVVYEIPYFYRSRRDVRTLFALSANPSLRIAKLYVLPDGAKQWQLIDSAIQLHPADAFTKGVDASNQLSVVCDGDANGHVAFVVVRDNRATVRLYDAARGQSVDLYELGKSDPDIVLQTAQLNDGTFQIVIVRQKQLAGVREYVARIRYRDRARTLLFEHGLGWPQAERADGTLVYEGPIHGNFVVVPPGGREGRRIHVDLNAKP